jgi:lia operon protein LiaI
MKKFALLVAGGIAAIVLIANLGPLVGLAISLLVLYFAVKKFLKADSTFEKVCWGLIAFAVLMVTASNIPAILAIAAAYILYVIYKNWDKKGSQTVVESNDPFTNFEKQWSQLNKN